MKGEMNLMNEKQTEVADVVEEMNTSVGAISLQLNSMAKAINSLRAGPNQHPNTTQGGNDVQGMPKSPTLQRSTAQHAQLTEELKKRLQLEQEKTRYLDNVMMANLPPIHTGRRSAPPGFAGFNKARSVPIDAQSGHTSTPAFNAANNPKLKQLWEGYARDYEKEMRQQFFKSVTKGPRMDFPRFDGENLVGWIRQCEK